MEGEVDSICQTESFWFTLKSTLCIQVLSKVMQLVFAKEMKHSVIGTMLS
jgi:hypothetical protein